ncbi:MAG TPA: lipid A biosynthesis acyltransferase [Chitinophagaceae bacterium]|nr:lipid A biosynthesis acyltransferase [Chitinophagaceae bacterium]
MSAWGSSRGSQLGYKIFITILKTAGIFPAYVLLRFVTLYYFFVPGKSGKTLTYYFNKRLGFSLLRTKLAIYQNFNYLGRSIIDKVVLMSGIPSPFSINHEGGDCLDRIAETGKGGLLISAHLGNWEAAGHLLKRLKTKINIVMYDGEHEKIKSYLDGVRERSFNVIVIKNDISHIYEINAALQRNEFVCIHADRYVEGNKTIETQLLGSKALFPVGPFVLATTFQAPVSFVFAMKEGLKHFHFFASEGKIYPRGKEGIPEILTDYTREMEAMIHRYPLQWHNYFEFWEEEKTHSDSKI